MSVALEEQALRATSVGQYDAANQAVDALETSGYAAARVLWLRATIRAYESEDNYEEALEMYHQASKVKSSSPDTYAVVLVEQTRIGYLINERQLMRRLRICAEDFWLRHSEEAEVQRWRGPTLLNFANHALRNSEYQLALGLFDQAIRDMGQRQEQWCMLVRAHLQRIWCLCMLGRPREAERSLTDAMSVERNAHHAADFLLARSRIAWACRYPRMAASYAQQAATIARENRMPDWQVVTEGRYQEMLVALSVGSEDAGGLAEQVRSLASRHRLSYMFRLIKLALAEPEEEVQRWGTL